jgi:hypothetical protein
VAAAAHDQGLPAAGRHASLPCGWLRPSFRRKVGEFADMMHFDVRMRPAQLARLGQEAFDHFTASAPDGFGRCLVDADPCIPLQRYAPKVRGQGLLWWFARDRDAEHLRGSVLRLDPGAVSLGDGAARRPIFFRSRLHQGHFHGVLQSLKPMEVVRHPIVLDEAPPSAWYCATIL